MTLWNGNLFLDGIDFLSNSAKALRNGRQGSAVEVVGNNINITIRNSRFEGNTAPEGSNGTASMPSTFKGSIRVTDTTFGIGDTVYDPAHHIQKCQSGTCSFDDGQGI